MRFPTKIMNSGYLKNILTKLTFEKTFLVDEVGKEVIYTYFQFFYASLHSVEYANLEKDTASYSWTDGKTFHFMIAETFEDVEIAKDDIVDAEFLTEGLEVKLQKFKDQIIGVELPKTQVYEVLSVDPTKTR
jgi:hypothetical protein